MIKQIATTLITTLLAAASAKAALTSYTDSGEILVGFRRTGATNCYMLKIDLASSLPTVGSTTFTIPGVATDLTAAFGSGWFTDTNTSQVYWSVFGDDQNTGFGLIYTGRSTATPWGTLTAGIAGDAFSNIQQATSGYANAVAATAESGLLQSVSAPFSYASYQPGGVNSGGVSFAIWNPSSEAAVSQKMYLNKLTLDSNGAATSVSVMGYFEISSGGVITYTAASVPTPTLSFSSASYSVSESGTSLAINISRGGDTTTACSVNFSTANATAVSGTDYTGQTNTLVPFSSNQTTATVSVDITDRPGYQGDRSFTVRLSGPSNGATLVSSSTAVVTILESSAAPTAITGLNPNHASAAGGSSVVITGTSFSGATAVSFGSTPATSFTVDSATQITAVAPAGTAGQTVDVTVIASGTSANTAADDFTFDAIVVPSPKITGLSPNHGAAAGGSSVVITGSNLTGASAVSFGSSAAASFTVDSATQITAVSSSGTAGQTVDVRVTTSGGTSENTTADNFTYDLPPAGKIALSASTYQVAPLDNQGSPTNVTITLLRTSGSNGSGSVALSATSATLISGSDYTFASPQTVNFDDGQVTKNVKLQLKSIAAAKLPATITLRLSNASGVSIGTQATASITISALDSVAPKLSLLTPSGKTVAASFDVTGVASDAQGIDRVEVRLNNGPIQLASLGAFTSGTAGFSLAGLVSQNGANSLTIQAVDLQGNKSSLLSKVVTYVNDRPALAGSYNGLLVSGSGASNDRSGLLTLKVTAAGLFTGKLTLGGYSLPVSGIFGNDGTGYFSPTMTDSVAMVGNAAVPVQFGSLALNLSTGTNRKVTGTLKDAGNSVIATIDADLAYFDGKINLPDAKYLKNKGTYTVVFAGKVPLGNPASSTYPQGDGFGSVTISSKGIATIKGNLGDGTSFSAAAPLSKDYRWPCYAQLYKKQGSIAGMVALDSTDPVITVKGRDLLWLRPAIADSSYYPAGWTGGITVDLLGAEYAVPPQPPVVPNPVSVFPGLKPIDSGTGNSILRFSDGKLSGTNGQLNLKLNIGTDNKTTNLTINGVLDKTFSLKINKSNGQISGSFTHTDLTKTGFKGVILQHDVDEGSYTLGADAYGYFLSNPVTGATGESGSVLLFAQ